MSIFTAHVALDMNLVTNDLSFLTDPTTDWSATATTFTASAADGSIVVHATGDFANISGGKPGPASMISSLTIEYGPIVHTTAYTIAEGSPAGLISFDGLMVLLGNMKAGDVFTEVLYVGNDGVVGSAGADTLHGFDGSDRLYGNGGNDTLFGDRGADYLYGNQGADVLHGGDDNDYLFGLGGNDKLYGDSGADTLRGGPGKDILVGDALDTADYSDKALSISVVLKGAGHTTVFVGGIAEDALAGIERVTGGKAGDKLVGDTGTNVLAGGGGADRLNGGGGLDQLSGGAGNDVLRGGAGGDMFAFDAALNAKTNIDTIVDFTPGIDHIVLSKAVFPGMVPGLPFFAVGVAKQPGDHIIYHANTGDLAYDVNGSAAGGETVFAHLAKHLTLTQSDFILIP